MHRIEQPGHRQPSPWFIILITLVFLLCGQAATVMAQATNTFPSSGNVGIGTSAPNEKLTVYGSNIRPILGESTTHTNIYSTYNSQSWNALEIFSNGNAYSHLVFTNNLTSGAIGGITFANKGAGVEGTNDLRLGGFYAYTDGAANSGYLNFWTANAGAVAERMRITSAGNVGIGTTSPNAPLEISKNQNAGTTMILDNGYATAGNAAYTALAFKQAGEYRFFFGSINDGNTTQEGGPGAVQFWNFKNGPMLFSTNNLERVRISGAGYVGIGTKNPTEALDVHGNINVTGNIQAKYQDVAEWVPSAHALPAGTVVTLNPQKSNQVMASSQAYDTKVAGVVSAQPGLVLGESSPDKVLVATTGRVKVKVDATRSAIHVGDLLVTSDKEGVAMKSEPLMIQGRQFHSPGTLIGKALEPLESGQGEILVLLSLQ